MSKRPYEEVFSDLIDSQEKTLIVNFACFITCISNRVSGDFSPGNLIIGMSIPGFDLPCILVAANKNQAIEIYLECDGLPLTKLIHVLEDMGMGCVAIFTFGSSPKTNGAPEALARIRFRICRCGFVGFSKGLPGVEECGDFDIRDKLPNWVRFTVDQMGLMLSADGSKPCEIVEWCVVACFGNTSKLEGKLKELRIRSGVCRQYCIKGFECMRMPMAARIYLEMEPIAKTVLLRCLIQELAMPVEIMTFPPNQQAKALAYVFELGGVLIERGNLSEVPVMSAVSCIITRFTQRDLAVWDCVVAESPPMHWSVGQRDAELVQLQSEAGALKMENSLLRKDSVHYNQQCGRLLSALEEIKADRDSIRKELDVKSAVDFDAGLFGWSEWETMRSSMDEKDKCISQLRAQLGEMNDHIRKLQQGEMISDGKGQWVCIAGNETLSALGGKVRSLEQRLESEFEGGLMFDETRNKYIETEGKTWTKVQWQARELEVYRNAFGPICVRDSFNEPDFSVGDS